MYENRTHRIMVRNERQEITKGGLESVLLLISGSVTTAWGVLRLRIEEAASDMEGSRKYIE